MNLEEAKAFFAHDVFATEASGIEILEVGEHYAKCEMKLDDRHFNAAGSVMGGAMFTLADFTFAVATNTPDFHTVTSVSQISYLSATKGKILYGEAKVIKEGKRACFYQVEITDDLGKLIAVVNTNGMHI